MTRIDLVSSLEKNFTCFAENDPDMKRLIMEFNNHTRLLCTPKLLLWCIALLVKYHKKEECSEHLSLVLKFKLVSYLEFGGSSFWTHSDKAAKVLVDYLQYISLHKLRRKYKQRSLLENAKRYLILVKYGFRDQRYERAFYDFEYFIQCYDPYNLFGFRNRIIRRRSNKMYRPCQILHLYIQSYYNDKDYGVELYDEVLRVLWNSIPDPFLLKKQFLSSFHHSDRFPEFLNVWKWYSKVVLNDVETEKSPRSLKHLTRCAIRRALTESVQMPVGIGSLNIPASLKSYLSLENCFQPED